VFITRGVQYEDQYKFTAYAINAGQAAMNQRISSVTPGSDPDYEAALDTHMNLPKGLDDDVYWLTQALTEDIESPVDKALALREHLLSAEYTYTLDVELPPKGRDFVSHFLLDTKEGYCTYYASAMAVMARLAGLPSRYVEGYLVHADPSGETLVRGENAHAWVEIYFEGLGWIPFDATPGRSGGGDHTGDTQQDENDTVPTPVPDADHEGDRPAQSEPTPTPTPEPTPTPTPESQHAPEHWAPTPTPDPSVQNDENSPEDDPSSEDEPSSRDRGWLRALLWILLILLVLLVLFALVRHRWIMRNPLTFDRRQESDEVRLLLWYRTMLTMLMRTGLVPEGGETPAAFARRAVESGVAPEALCLLAGAVERQQYARKPADEETVNQARALYVQMLGALSARERLRWYAYCMTKGTGSFSQIP